MAAAPPRASAVFLHRDFLSVNVLWSRGRLTGLTDWNGNYRGSRPIDVGECRFYLAALYSPEWSEQLRSLYESTAAVALDPGRDLLRCCTITMARRRRSAVKSLGAVPLTWPA